MTAKAGQFEGGYVTNHVTNQLPACNENSSLIDLYGRGARIRTADLLRPRQARYQAAPRPEWVSRIILPSLANCVQSVSAVYVFSSSRQTSVQDALPPRRRGI
jgi:hypothetical protein